MASANETLSEIYVVECVGTSMFSEEYRSSMSYEAWKLAWIPEGRYSNFQWLTSHGRGVTQAIDVLDNIGPVHNPVAKEAEEVGCSCFACRNNTTDNTLKNSITEFTNLTPINKQDDYDARILIEEYLPALLEQNITSRLPGGYKSPADIYYTILDERSEEE